MSRKPRLALSANASPLVGGQGLALHHMMEAYAPITELEVLDLRRVPGSRVARAIQRVPLLRRRSDLLTLAGDLSFDRHVTEMLPEADAFQGVVGQCANAIAEAKRRGMHTVLDVLNSHVDDYQAHVTRESAKFGLRSFIHPKMVERIEREYREADVIRVMSRVAARTFEERGFPSSRIVVATPPMDVTEFPVARFDDDVFRIIFVGLVAPWKGFHLLIDVFERLKLPRAELVIWGGPGARSITNFIKRAQARTPSIKLRPVAIRSAGFAEVYGKASVLVHPSLADGFAYVVTEAMASGLPVIVTNNTGASDVVREGENGYVVPAGDEDALAERIAYLYAHREKLPELGRRARETAATLTLESFRASMQRCLGERLGAT
jgi:glycosyltransferase involved in cell wall biosynthesis